MLGPGICQCELNLGTLIRRRCRSSPNGFWLLLCYWWTEFCFQQLSLLRSLVFIASRSASKKSLFTSSDHEVVNKRISIEIYRLRSQGFIITIYEPPNGWIENFSRRLQTQFSGVFGTAVLCLKSVWMRFASELTAADFNWRSQADRKGLAREKDEKKLWWYF